MAGVHPNVPAEEIRLALSVTGTLTSPEAPPNSASVHGSSALRCCCGLSEKEKEEGEEGG